MRLQLLAATILAGGLAFPALTFGQEATDTDAAQPTATTLQQADMQFVNEAAAAGKAEVELGRLAVGKARDAAVKQFGQRMVDDHSRANEQLTQIVTGKDIELPAELSPDAQEARDHLASLSGSEFDREFMTHMVSDHEKAVALFTTQSQSGQDPELKQFAEETLPTLQEHLDEAKRIETGLQQVAGGETPEEQSQPAAGAATGTADEPMTTGSAEIGSTTAESTAEPTAPTDGTAAEGTAEQPTTTQEAARPAYPLGGKTADELIGQSVVNQNGEEVGELADIVLNANDQAVLAVISVGGFLGFGAKNVAVPFEQLQPSGDESILMSTATEEQLKSLPDYEEGEGYTAVPRDRPIGDSAL